MEIILVRKLLGIRLWRAGHEVSEKRGPWRWLWSSAYRDAREMTDEQ